MNRNELVELFRVGRKYSSLLTLDGPRDGLNQVKCTVTRWDADGKSNTVSSVHNSAADFFSSTNDTFDIVLVVESHTCIQALDSIKLSLQSIRPGGILVVHGGVPETPCDARPFPCGSRWRGDTYRAISWYFARSPYLCYTVTDDTGISVVDTAAMADSARGLGFPFKYMTDITFAWYKAHRDDILHVVTVDKVREMAVQRIAVQSCTEDSDLGRAMSLQVSQPEEPSVPDGVYIVPVPNERTGNNALQVYRGFWLAAVHGIPESNVRIVPTPHLFESPALFSRIRGNVMSDDEALNMPVATIHCCPDSMPSAVEGRRTLVDMPMPKRGAFAMTGAGFVYPELPWERSLFVKLFDNPRMRAELAAEYSGVLCGSTVGYQVRRGDFQYIPGRRRLTPEMIMSDIADIAKRYFGMVKVIIATDDTGFIKRILHANEFLRKYVFVCEGMTMEQELYLLSMCDSVVANGQYQCSSCWVNDPQLMWESTFGQIAQLLNRSYKYASLPSVPPVLPVPPDDSTRNGCDCEYPTREINRRW